MPRVGQREFPYTLQGRQAADRYARQTGQAAQDRLGDQVGQDPRANPNVYRTTMQEIRDRDQARRPRADVGRGTGFLPEDYDYGKLRRRGPDTRSDRVTRDRGPGPGPWGSPSPGAPMPVPIPGGGPMPGPSQLDPRSIRSAAISAQMQAILAQMSPEDQRNPEAVNQIVQEVNDSARRAAGGYGPWGEDVSGPRWDPRRG
jgi:hypothetical protein